MKTLIVEDDPLFIKLVLVLLDKPTSSVDATLVPVQGLECLRSKGYDFLITDLQMDEMNGAELIEVALKEELVAKERILVITGERSGASLVWLREQGIRILYKPFTAKEFRTTLSDMRPEESSQTSLPA